MIKRRVAGVALPYSTCCHIFHTTSMATSLQNGGALEHASGVAAHELPRTTKLYDRTLDEISLKEVERAPSHKRRLTRFCLHGCMAQDKAQAMIQSNMWKKGYLKGGEP
jgi:hypothetical protein